MPTVTRQTPPVRIHERCIEHAPQTAPAFSTATNHYTPYALEGVTSTAMNSHFTP